MKVLCLQVIVLCTQDSALYKLYTAYIIIVHCCASHCFMYTAQCSVQINCTLLYVHDSSGTSLCMCKSLLCTYIYMTVLLCRWCTCNKCTVHYICDVLYKQCIYCQTQCTRYQFYVTRSTSSFHFSSHKIFDNIFLVASFFVLLILKSIVIGSVHRTQCLALTHHLMFP